MKFSQLSFWLVTVLLSQVLGSALKGRPGDLIKHDKRGELQNIVTWDEHSIYVHGQRVLFYSGEVHPYRMPVAGLYLDVFQKIRALGYTGVSFYTDWALLEGKQGDFSAEGIFSLQPFFDAAQEAGIYLLARPGPYINAESSGGGYPGMSLNRPHTSSFYRGFMSAGHITDPCVNRMAAANRGSTPDSGLCEVYGIVRLFIH